MFIANRLVFLELQKTGGSHIRRLLRQYTDGEIVGKHNRLLKCPSDHLVVGSIRNPWDWYVSLWAYGAGGKGAIRSRTAMKLDLTYYHRMLPKDMGKNWLTPKELFYSIAYDVVKPVNQWQASYVDAGDANLFRQWLKLLLDPDRRFDIGEGFGFSPLSQHAGLLSYRYFRLFTLGPEIFNDKRLAVPEYLEAFDAEHTIAGAMIRTESLEEDFVKALQKAGVELNTQQQAAILNRESGKTNVSKRKPVDYYYDSETVDLVARADQFLIDKFAYTAPL